MSIFVYSNNSYKNKAAMHEKAGAGEEGEEGEGGDDGFRRQGQLGWAAQFATDFLHQ